MNFRRFMMLSGTLSLLFVAYIGGCGGSGGSGMLTGAGGAGGAGGGSGTGKTDAGACNGQFPDQGTVCTDCLNMNCAMQFTTCCMTMNCETLAKAARGKMCSGADCYGTAAMPGPIRSLIEDPDFGGAVGVPSPAWPAAQALIECTVAHCMSPICAK